MSKKPVSNERILVCGGCLFKDLRYLAAKLDELHDGKNVKLVIEGDASGADAMAGMWANARGVPLAVMTPQWDYYKGDAWWRRNESMLLLNPTRIIAFPGGGGTAHMLMSARKRGIPILHFSHKVYQREMGKPAYIEPKLREVENG